MQQYRDLKYLTALHVTAYSSIIRYFEIRGNCCAFRATKIGVYVFTVFLNEVNVVPHSMPNVFSFFGMPIIYQVCSVDVAWWATNKTKNKF
jgi:hypothetical protein